MYKPNITEKVIIIDEEPIKPIGKSSIRKKTHVTKPEKNKFKKGDLIINKKTITGKNKVLTRKQGKKIPNPKIGYVGNEPKHMQNRSQANQTRKDSLELLVEEAYSILQMNQSI
jgi:hypothetical protein